MPKRWCEAGLGVRCSSVGRLETPNAGTDLGSGLGTEVGFARFGCLELRNMKTDFRVEIPYTNSPNGSRFSGRCERYWTELVLQHHTTQ